MKAIKKFSVGISIALITLLIFSSCHKNNNSVAVSGMYSISGSASGSQVVPSVSGSATGNISGTYNANTNLLSYDMTWNGLTSAATAAAFYSGSAGVNGTLIGGSTITTAGVSGASTGSMTLTDAQETDLLSGKWYYIVSTATNVSGEIRGQMSTTAQ